MDCPTAVALSGGRGGRPVVYRHNGDGGLDYRPGLNVFLLPYLEQENMYKELDLTKSVFEEPNLSLAKQSMEFFVCPSDGRQPIDPFNAENNWRTTNYVGVMGAGRNGRLVDLEDSQCGDYYTDGMFYPYSSTRMADIRDGTSNTLAIGERTYALRSWQKGGWRIGDPPTQACVFSAKNLRWPINSDPAVLYYTESGSGNTILFNDSPLSNQMGLRKDVIQAAAELGVPIIRWPGGSFADVYHWEDGVGPRDARPKRKNKQWGGTESNQFGTDEFLQWCKLVGAEPYINFNLGTGTLAEALQWVDYCNGTKSSSGFLQRKANGHKDPYHVKFWGIGNETYARHEAGHMDAETYGKTLAEWAWAVKKRDPGVRILAVGSPAGNNPKWDRAVLTHAGRYIDYLTTHIYGISRDRRTGKDYYRVVFTPVFFEHGFLRMLKTVDEVSATLGRTEPIRLALDEWNVRHYEGSTLNRKSPRSIQDAIFVAGVFNAMIRQSPRVGMANYVFLVNGHGAIKVNSDGILRSSIYYVFQQYTRWMKGQALQVTVRSPTRTVELPQTCPRFDTSGYDLPEVPYLGSVAALNEDGTLVLSLLNRHKTAEIEVELRLPVGYQPRQAWTLHCDDIYAFNDFGATDRIKPVVQNIAGRTMSWKCPPHSVVLLSCEITD